MIAHSYSLPYGLLMRNVTEATLERVEICISPTDVSEYTEEEVKKVSEEVGQRSSKSYLLP